MKLLDIVVQEVRKWPKGMEYAVMDEDKQLKFSPDLEAPFGTTDQGIWIRERCGAVYNLEDLADDFTTAVVYKRDWEEAKRGATFLKTLGTNEEIKNEISHIIQVMNTDLNEKVLDELQEHLRECLAMVRSNLK